MPINVQLYEHETRIIAYTFEGKWTWNELNAALPKAVALLDGEERADVIIFYNCGTYLPKLFITNLRSMAKRQLENAGLTVVVSDNDFVQQMFRVSQKVDDKVANIMHCVASEQEAVALIRKNRRLSAQN